MMSWEIDISKNGEWETINRVFHNTTELIGGIKTLIDLTECDIRVRRIPVEKSEQA